LSTKDIKFDAFSVMFNDVNKLVIDIQICWRNENKLSTKTKTHW